MKRLAEKRNLLARIACCPVPREDFTRFCIWEGDGKERELASDAEMERRGHRQNRKGFMTRRENFAILMINQGFLSCGRKTNILRITRKGSAWVWAFDMDRMLRKFGHTVGSSSGILSFGA